MDRLTNNINNTINKSNNDNNYGLWIIIGIIILILLHYIIVFYKNKDKKTFKNINDPLLITNQNQNQNNINNNNNKNKNQNQNQNNINNNNNKKQNESKIRYIYNDVIDKNINTNDDNNSTAVYESNSYDDYIDRFLIDRTKVDTIPPYDFFDMNKNDDDEKQRNEFLDEYTKYTRFNKEQQKEFTDKDIDNHRNSYLDFHDKINMTTSGFDHVDRMNLVQLNENSFNKSNNNKSIAQIFDNLVDNQRPKYNNQEIKDYTTNALSFEYADDPKYKVNNFYNGLENYNYSTYGYNGFL